MMSDWTLADASEFWAWFSTIAAELAVDPSNSRLLSELNNRVDALGPLAWEVGPGTASPNMLVISPDGDPDKLSLTRAIVAQAPKLPDWEFHSSKPAKQWTGMFTVVSHGLEIGIDASQWKYILFAYDDGVCDVQIFAPNLQKFSEQQRVLIAELAVEHSLGEELRLACVSDVEVVSDREPERGIDFGYLREQLCKICSKRALPYRPQLPS